MTEVKVGEYWSIKIPVKVFRDLGKGIVDVCTEDGDCFNTDSVNFTNQINNTDMKQMRQAVLDTAKSLCKANNTVTTLEIKQELRRDYPYFYWDQSTVSKYMDSLAGDGIFKYTDNGTYRTYSLANQPSTKRLAKVTKVTATRAKQINRNNLVTYLQKTPKVEGVYLVSGKFVSLQDIYNQKKSLIGYVSQRPNLTGVQVNGVLVAVR